MEKSSIVNRVAARFIQASKITLGPGREDTQNSAVLQKAKLKAKSNGDLESAILSAGFYAKKLKKTMFVFKGNSFMHAVWRASYKLGITSTQSTTRVTWFIL